MSADRILSQILTSGAAAGFAGGLAGGLLASRSGRKLGKTALAAGGMAALGGLAQAAWQRWHRESTARGKGSRQVPPPIRDRFVPPAACTEETEAMGSVLIQAMIAAAHADGGIDLRETARIRSRIAGLDLSAEERQALLGQIERPVSLSTLVARARTREHACEIYTASLLAIDADTPAEHAYLSLLAARLELAPDLVDAIHAEAGLPPVASRDLDRLAS